MNTSMGILAVVGVIGLLAIVAGYRFVAQRRQLSSGRNIGRFAPKKQVGQYISSTLSPSPPGANGAAW